MICPNCKTRLNVIDSRADKVVENIRHRQYLCTKCKTTVYTKEIVSYSIKKEAKKND